MNKQWSASGGARAAVRDINATMDFWLGRGSIPVDQIDLMAAKTLWAAYKQVVNLDDLQSLPSEDFFTFMGWHLGLTDMVATEGEVLAAYRHDLARSLRDRPVFILSPAMMDCCLAAAQTLETEDLIGWDVPADHSEGTLVFPTPLIARGNYIDVPLGAISWRPGVSVDATHKNDPDQVMQYITGAKKRPIHTVLQTWMARPDFPSGVWWPGMESSLVVNATGAAMLIEEAAERQVEAERHSDDYQSARMELAWDYDPSQGADNTRGDLRLRVLAAFFMLREQAQRTTETSVSSGSPRRGKKTSARKAAGRRKDSDPVTVVDISFPKNDGLHSTGVARPVEWRHQWVVSMHKRKQWFGPIHDRRQRIIFVGPYIKGPAGAPMKPRFTSVKAVVTPPQIGELNGATP